MLLLFGSLLKALRGLQCQLEDNWSFLESSCLNLQPGTNSKEGLGPNTYASFSFFSGQRGFQGGSGGPGGSEAVLRARRRLVGGARTGSAVLGQPRDSTLGRTGEDAGASKEVLGQPRNSTLGCAGVDDDCATSPKGG